MKKILENIKKNTFIILLVTILVMYLVLKDNFKSIINLLIKADFKYILIAFILFLLSIFFQAYVLYKIIGNKKKYSLKEAMKLTTIIQFFNGITPFSTGGQPVEVY